MSADDSTRRGPLPGELPHDGFVPPQMVHYPLPERTPENFVCVRGPCRHYWHLVTDAHVGNVIGTFEDLGREVPKLHHHVCLLSQQETEFEEDIAYECSRWDPLEPKELLQIQKRRDRYHKRAEKK